MAKKVHPPHDEPAHHGLQVPISATPYTVSKLSFMFLPNSPQINFYCELTNGQNTGNQPTTFEGLQFLSFIWKQGWKLYWNVTQAFPGGFLTTSYE